MQSITSRPKVTAHLTIKDRDWGYGLNAGILFEAAEKTRIGVAYLPQVNLDFSDVPELENPGPMLAMALEAGNLINTSNDLGIKVPRSIMVGIYRELGEKFALMANAGWQDWSTFGKADVAVDSNNPVSLTTETNFDNTWHAALGGQFRPSKQWILSAGVAYDSSMFRSKHRTPALPIGKAWRYGLGAQFAACETLTMGLGYEFIWTGAT